MKRVLVALLAVGLVAAAACSGDSGDAAEEGPVKYGFLNGQSGDYGPWGHWALAAAEVAVEELNAGGGVLGRSVELVVEDNGSTPEGAVSGFAELTEVDGIHALGGIESDGMIAIFDTVHELQIPTICSTCGTTELDNTGGDMVFRIIPSDTDNGIVGAQVARDEGYRNVAMLVELSEGTESPANVFKAVFTEQMGGSVTADVRFNAGETTYAAQVAQAFESGPDAVYIAAGFETGVPLLNEWQRRGYSDIPLILTTDLLSPEIAEIISGVEGASAIVGATAYDTENNPAWDAYVPRFEAKIGDPPEIAFYDAWQYDQYIILGLATAKAGTTDGAAVAAAIPEIANPPGVEVFSYAQGLAELEAGNDIDYHGTTSNMNLNSVGNLLSPVMAVIHVQDGDWAVRENIELDPTLVKPS
ncbi:MAG: ABC transporter substrate-binding protein [Acidimicrobiaceae bacterium]|nr:ABC transporter substrate-binding protein [Acidimicrobiaceae bacterium]MCY3643889.1 ABC transporter substrate-binding protein [Acidimicrobiaceae bacterium]MDE0494512.1 ABC transporter substrate-binding protein [Acidimicrobiaceae bacterium]MDE0665751.1 ABC transporter substrate-binding protein [Acidimicrobiaceae bacterium]